MTRPDAPDTCHQRLPGRPVARSQCDRRREIVQAAACVFSECGYRAATMDEISRRAGMSKRTVYTLFASKAEIFDVLLQDWAHPFSIPLEGEGQTQREILVDALDRLANFAIEEAQLAISRVLIAEVGQSSDVADALARIGIDRGEWALQQWLAAQTRLGRYPIGDPEALAGTIFYAVVGDALIHRLLRLRPRPCRTVLRDRIERVVGMFFDPPP